MFILFLLSGMLCSGTPASVSPETGTFCPGTHETESDVFSPIAKYIKSGDCEKLSVWFDDHLELSVFSQKYIVSRIQAKQIMKNFFESKTPSRFEITHRAGRYKMRYALGDLVAGGESYEVSIYIVMKNNYFWIKKLNFIKKSP